MSSCYNPVAADQRASTAVAAKKLKRSLPWELSQFSIFTSNNVRQLTSKSWGQNKGKYDQNLHV